MARKAKKEPEITIAEAIAGYAEEKNFTEEFVESCLKNAIIKAYCRIFWGIVDIEGGELRVDFEPNNVVKITIIKTVKEEVEDDFTEIDFDEDEVIKQGLKPGDKFEASYTFETLKEDTINFPKFQKSWATTFTANIAAAEKEALLDVYKGKIGDLILVHVKQYNKDRDSYYVMVGKTNAVLERRDLIGDEILPINTDVKVYLQSVDVNPRGAVLRISRSCPEFLRRIFETEVHEVYDGTVVIAKIARSAGVRSKVAVYSENPEVDACGACIGRSGDRIAAITTHLGNSKEKEKIDVVLYDRNKELFAAESLVPAHVVGISISSDEKNCVAVVKNSESSQAIGKKGINVQLASRLIGMSIAIKEQDEAFKEGIVFKDIETIKKEAEAEKAAKLAAFKEENAPIIETSEPVIETEIEEEKIESTAPVSEENIAKTEVKEEAPIAQNVNNQEIPAAAPVSEESKVDVKVTTSISELEKQIEEEKKNLTQNAPHTAKKTYKKKDKNNNDKPSLGKKNEPLTGMAIYTDEELAELDKEENDYGVDEETDNYDEYDSDDLYDENDK